MAFEILAEQPPAFVAVTEYEVLAVGLTVIEEEVDPVFHT